MQGLGLVVKRLDIFRGVRYGVWVWVTHGLTLRAQGLGCWGTSLRESAVRA